MTTEMTILFETETVKATNWNWNLFMKCGVQFFFDVATEGELYVLLFFLVSLLLTNIKQNLPT